MSKFYPAVSLQFLELARILKTSLNDDPEFLTDLECPYCDETIEILLQLFPSKVSSISGEAVDIDTEDKKLDSLLRDLEVLNEEIRTNPARTSESPSEQNSYFRTRLGLIEKIVEVRERLSNLKEYKDFTAAILAVMDEKLPADIRTEVISELKKLSGREA